jgi:hypothetical protein
MVHVTGDNYFEVPADGGKRWVYVLFQSANTRWRVVGARIIDKEGFGSDAFYVKEGPGEEDGWITGSDVPLLGEALPGEPVAEPVLSDAVLRDKLVAAYRQKMQSSPTSYSDTQPVHVVRFRLKGHVPGDFTTGPTGNTKTILAFPRVAVEPPLDTFPAGEKNAAAFGNNVNRGNYPPQSAAQLYVRYVAP